MHSVQLINQRAMVVFLKNNLRKILVKDMVTDTHKLVSKKSFFVLIKKLRT